MKKWKCAKRLTDEARPGSRPAGARPRRGRRAIAACALAAACTVAAAQAPGRQPTVWVCWQSGAATLACQLGTTPALKSGARAGRSDGDELDVPVPRGRRPLPPIVHTILRRPGALYGREISIPLLSEPAEMSFAHELALSVMCGANRACEVLFVESGSAAALRLDELENDASD